MDWFYVLFVSYVTLIGLNSKVLFASGMRSVTVSGFEFFAVFFTIVYTFLLVGMRDSNGLGDTPQYLYVFDNLQSLGSSWIDGFQLYGNTELLFWPAAYAFKALGFSAESWMAAIVVVTTAIVAYSYKGLGLGRLWYVAFSGLYLTYYIVFMAAIRQSIAESLVLLAIVLARSNKIASSVFFLVAATGFHSSAALGFSILILRRFNIKPKLMAASIFIAFIGSVLAPSILASVFGAFGFENTLGKVAMYSSVDGGNEFGNLFQHKQFLLLFVVFVSYLAIFRGATDFVYKFIFFLVFILFFFWSMPVMSGRVMGYLTLLLPYMVAKLALKFLGESNSIIFCWLLFSIMGILVLSTKSTQLVLGFI